MSSNHEADMDTVDGMAIFNRTYSLYEIIPHGALVGGVLRAIWP